RIVYGIKADDVVIGRVIPAPAAAIHLDQLVRGIIDLVVLVDVISPAIVLDSVCSNIAALPIDIVDYAVSNNVIITRTAPILEIYGGSIRCRGADIANFQSFNSDIGTTVHEKAKLPRKAPVYDP